MDPSFSLQIGVSLSKILIIFDFSLNFKGIGILKKSYKLPAILKDKKKFLVKGNRLYKIGIFNWCPEEVVWSHPSLWKDKKNAPPHLRIKKPPSFQLTILVCPAFKFPNGPASHTIIGHKSESVRTFCTQSIKGPIQYVKQDAGT